MCILICQWGIWKAHTLPPHMHTCTHACTHSNKHTQIHSYMHQYTDAHTCSTDTHIFTSTHRDVAQELQDLQVLVFNEVSCNITLEHDRKPELRDTLDWIHEGAKGRQELACTRVWACVCMCVCVCASVCARVWACMCICVRVCICLYVNAWMCARMHVPVCVCVRAGMQACVWFVCLCSPSSAASPSLAGTAFSPSTMASRSAYIGAARWGVWIHLVLCTVGWMCVFVLCVCVCVCVCARTCAHACVCTRDWVACIHECARLRAFRCQKGVVLVWTECKGYRIH